MSVLSLRLPDSIHDRAREFAELEGISINQFIATAVAEKLASLLTVKYLQLRAARAKRGDWEAILANVPDVPPIPGDELPPGWSDPPAKPRARKRAAAKRSRRS